MSIRLLALSFGIAASMLVANVLLTILYMVVYGHLIDPGHEPEYYSDHVQVAGPYCGIIGGSFLSFLVGLLIARNNARPNALKKTLVVWANYGILDFAILAAAGLTSSTVALFAVSMFAKALTSFAGVRTGSRSASSI